MNFKTIKTKMLYGWILIFIGLCSVIPINAQDIKLKNKTRFNLAVSVNFLDNDGDWIVEHVVVPAKNSRYCCKTDNRTIYYYAIDTHGYGWHHYGYDTYAMNAYNRYVGFRKKKLSKSFQLTITE